MKADANEHWNECTVCGIEEARASHSFQWVIDKHPGVNQKGSKHEECSVCHYKKAAVEIPATGWTGWPGYIYGTYVATGDESNPVLWLVLMLTAAAGLTGAVIYGRKKKYNK